MDADHLDIYGEEKELINTFKDFTSLIPVEGKLFVRYGLELGGITYGIDERADYSILNKKIESGSYVFDIKTPKEVIENVRFNIPGNHNLENALWLLQWLMITEYQLKI